jgi:ubiquinone biosynthesis protein UbiJ
LHSDYGGEADTTIISSPLGLIRLSFLPASKVRSLFNDQIKITGDTELGQQVKKLFDELDIDWEGHLAQFTGDVVAYQLGSLFRKGREIKDHAGASLRQNISEYLQEELRFFPPREEIDDFFMDIDEMSLSVERLTARVNQLMADNEIN